VYWGGTAEVVEAAVGIGQIFVIWRSLRPRLPIPRRLSATPSQLPVNTIILRSALSNSIITITRWAQSVKSLLARAFTYPSTARYWKFHWKLLRKLLRTLCAKIEPAFAEPGWLKETRTRHHILWSLRYMANCFLSGDGKTE